MTEVLTVDDIGSEPLVGMLDRYGFELVIQSPGEAIRGSFWGDCEAGVVGLSLFVRADTPIHSVLHESCHVVCMDGDRRADLDRDAGGDDLEESAVCFLQILLADYIAGVGRERIMDDMDAWGYSFRLGNTRAWFERDAADAKEFLLNHGVVNDEGKPTFILRA